MEPQAECMLVIIGATPEGKKELVGFQVGTRESAQSWHELLVGLKARGLAMAPELAVGDGALGFWRALEEAFPSVRHQRCWVHKAANVLDKLPKSLQGKHLWPAYVVQLDAGLAAQGKSSWRRLFGWPRAIASRVAVR